MSQRPKRRRKPEPGLFEQYYNNKKRTTYHLMILSFALCGLVVIYDVLMPDPIQNGLIIRTVPDAVYDFLNFFFGTCIVLYGGRKLTDVVAMTKIDRLRYGSNGYGNEYGYGSGWQESRYDPFRMGAQGTSGVSETTPPEPGDLTQR